MPNAIRKRATRAIWPASDVISTGFLRGVKRHLLVTADGEPVEIFLTPGAVADVNALQVFTLDLPEGSTVYADSAFTDVTSRVIISPEGAILSRPSGISLPDRRPEPRDLRCRSVFINKPAPPWPCAGRSVIPS